MFLEKDQIKIGNYIQYKRLYGNGNVFKRKNYKDSEKFLVLLLMNFKFICNVFQHQQDFFHNGFINFQYFWNFLEEKNRNLLDKNI